MRIVHWGKYYPPRMGGIESVTRVLATGHAAAGHRVAVVCFGSGPTEIVELEGVQLLRCRERVARASQPLGWDYWRLGLRLGRAADIVHLHAPNLLAGLMALRLPRRARLVVHWHSDIVDKGWLGRLLRPIERAMLARADAIVCTSPAYAEHSPALQRWRAKLHSVPIGIADPAARGEPGPLPAAVARFLAGRRYVFSVGRLVPYKGFAHLVDAAAMLPPDLAVVIAGDGPLRDELQSRARAAGALGRVLFVGSVTESELDALLGHASLFCLPSVARSEAFGVVLLEAMARALPIVATQIAGSGVPWVNQQGESGLNVAPADAAALAAACASISGDAALRERLSRGARQHFVQRFTAGTFAAAMLVLYRRTIGKSPDTAGDNPVPGSN